MNRAKASRDGAESVPAVESIRGQYERLGSDAYYRDFGGLYRNPHEPSVSRCIASAVKRWPLDFSSVLDLAAGSGEATLAIRQIAPGSHIVGIDPHTHAAYLARTGRDAERWSFDDIADGILIGRQYSLIVCSFALHLCEASRLPIVAYQLSRCARMMMILTPHKRPHLREPWGWRLDGEFVQERVRTRLYYASTFDM